jgi:carbonic anhydrase
MCDFGSEANSNPLTRNPSHSASDLAGGSQPISERRRRFLQMAVGSTVGGLVASAGMDLLNPTSAFAQASLAPQTSLTPRMALRELVRGNRRFVAVRMRSFELDLAILRNHTSEQQQPFAAILSCADSRVPVELVFDQSIGQIFAVRVAGNVTTAENIASLEYGTAVLGAKVLVVMGHGMCGAVQAAIDGKEAPGQISALYSHLQPAIDEAGPDVDAVAQANARLQADLLRKASPVISGLIKEEKLLVLSAFYNLASGEVTFLDRDMDTSDSVR